MKRSRTVRLLAASLFLGACSTEDVVVDEEVQNRTPYEQLAVTADTSEGFEEGAPVPVTPVQGGRTVGGPDGPLTATGTFRGLAEGSYPPGSVVVTEEGTGTQVSVKIDRYEPGTELEVSIVRGGCQLPGTEVVSLGMVEVGPAGFATEIFHADIPTQTVISEAYSIRLNTPGGEHAPEFVLACADMPAV